MTKRKSSDQQEDARKSRRMTVLDDDDGDVNDKENDINASQMPDFDCPDMREEGEVGVIESIKLKNFMCHDRLDVNFDPHCNFVIGRNGSGKSAILTGLVVGLGGKAAITNRGNSLKGFIKSGRSSAEVEIALRNRGVDAYKPDVYGKTIRITRKLCDGGSGGYKIQDEKGKMVTQKREELDRIMDEFNIQVDNPLVILNQDTSRNFLHSKQPGDKYKFFLKATQLEQMKHDYVLANESRGTADGILQDKKDILPQLEKEVLDWEQKFKMVSSLEDLRKKVYKLNDETAWALIFEKEQVHAKMAKETQVEEARTPKFIHSLEKATEKVKTDQARKKEIQERLKSASKEVEALAPKHDEMKKEREAKRKMLRTSQAATRKTKHDVDSNIRERDEILKRIEERRNSTQPDFPTEKTRREMRILTLTEKLDALTAQKNSTNESLERFRSAVNYNKEQLYHVKSEEQDARTRLDQCKRETHELESARTNKMRLFGTFMPDLLKKIDQAAARGEFHRKPLGPIGSFLTVKNRKWALAIENCLGGNLQSFCVHNHHDERVLEKVFNQARLDRKPTIITCEFCEHHYDVSRNSPPTDTKWTTVIEELNISNPIISNTLIDQRGIECVLLFHNTEEARNIMMHGGVQNAQQGYLANGDQMYSYPTFRSYPTNKSEAKFLSASVEENIKHLKEVYRKYEIDHANAKQKLQETDGEVRSNQQLHRQCETQLVKIQNHFRIMQDEKAELESFEDPAPVDVTVLQEEVDRYDQLIRTLSEKHETTAAEFNTERQELEQLEQELKQIESRFKQARDDTEPMTDELAVIEQQIDQAKHYEQHYRNKHKEHEKKIKTLHDEEEKSKADLQESIAKAETICARVNTRRKVSDIEAQVRQLKKRITEEEKSRGNPEEITRTYHDKLSKFREIKKDVRQLSNFLKKLNTSMDIRHNRFVKMRASIVFRIHQYFCRYVSYADMHGSIRFNHKKERLDIIAFGEVMDQRQRNFFEFRRSIAFRIRYLFGVFLGVREYAGKLVFDHANEKLLMDVQPTRVNGEGNTDLKSLSGGERSFSTVCFILALWDAMESPFRCLDEFDVFMDLVNRRKSMDMMMEVASNQTGRQFIFLTPQDVSGYSTRAGSKLIRLRAPERGQGTLNFGTQNNQEQEQE